MGLGPPVCIKCNLMLRLGVGWSCSGCGGTEYAGLWEVDKETQDAIEANEDFLSQIRQTLNEIEMEQTMTEKPTTQIPLSRRVMPSIIAHDIKGVSPMIGPIETKSMISSYDSPSSSSFSCDTSSSSSSSSSCDSGGSSSSD